jgi:hypothetical protein
LTWGWLWKISHTSMPSDSVSTSFSTTVFSGFRRPSLREWKPSRSSMMMHFLPISVNSAPKSPSGSSESSRSSLDCNERDEDIRMQCLDALVVCHPSTKFRARGDDNLVGDPVFFVEVELRQKGRHTSRCKDRHRQLRSHRRAKPETGGLATVRASTHTSFFVGCCSF